MLLRPDGILDIPCVAFLELHFLGNRIHRLNQHNGQYPCCILQQFRPYSFADWNSHFLELICFIPSLFDKFDKVSLFSWIKFETTSGFVLEYSLRAQPIAFRTKNSFSCAHWRQYSNNLSWSVFSLCLRCDKIALLLIHISPSSIHNDNFYLTFSPSS